MINDDKVKGLPRKYLQVTLVFESSSFKFKKKSRGY